MSESTKNVYAPEGSGYIIREELQTLLEGLFSSGRGHDFKIRVR